MNTNLNTIKLATSKLPVMESFYSIQGEGYHSGKAACFIRLAGCDVGCYWCDVKESWDRQKHPLLNISNIVKVASDYPANNIVVTGGEPLMYNLDQLCEELNSYNLWIETSGAYPLSGNWDWICVSPKKFKPPLPKVLEKADELKVIVCNKSDFLWAEKYALKVNQKCRLYLQPEWSKMAALLPLIIDYVKIYPKWNISLQIHKFMDIR